MYIVYDETKYIYMYFAQLVYFMAVIMIYVVFYPKASRLLVNNMCMLMAVGFVMIARLDYNKCVKQFVIAVARYYTYDYCSVAFKDCEKLQKNGLAVLRCGGLCFLRRCFLAIRYTVLILFLP